jgi:16S rRNA (uracil1498-N3)-methyltransferase
MAPFAAKKAPKDMPAYDFRTPRLYLDAPLQAGATVALGTGQVNYLQNVLRLRPGAGVLIFNGRDGEWLGALAEAGKRKLSVTIRECVRQQVAGANLHYLFAPLKHARLDYVVQKAVELGVSRLQPVSTRHTQAARVNLDRMEANVIEAAEQCGILTLPDVAQPISLDQMISAREPERLLVFCDEDAPVQDPVAALTAARSSCGQPLSVLIGPEGGFAEDERALLMRQPNIVRLALGPRILRADTAAVAALALVGAVLGDWK